MGECQDTTRRGGFDRGSRFASGIWNLRLDLHGSEHRDGVVSRVHEYGRRAAGRCLAPRARRADLIGKIRGCGRCFDHGDPVCGGGGFGDRQAFVVREWRS